VALRYWAGFPAPKAAVEALTTPSVPALTSWLLPRPLGERGPEVTTSVTPAPAGHDSFVLIDT
jgi:hypothetical protein